MIGLGGGRAIFLATGPTDLRKSFTGLYALVREQLAQEPLSGAVFAFCNRRRDTVKLFCYDAGGFWICAKRLEAGTFRWPAAGTRSVELTPTDLTLLLSGIDPAPSRVRRWWRPVEASAR
ncbi:MAG: IS66 family insertion sequence element accessory protein TnpB [Rhizomicrobium sp.]